MSESGLERISIFYGDGEKFDSLCPNSVLRVGSILYRIVVSENAPTSIAELDEMHDTVSNG